MKLQNTKLTKSSEVKAAEILKNESLSKSAKIKQLFSLGYETKQIATLLNIRYNFAYNVLSNYIITDSLAVETVKTESKKDIIKQLFLEKKSAKEIAVELKTNMNYIYKIIKEIKDEELAAEAK